MPELPEVETVRRGLAGTIVGRRVVDVVVTGARTVRRTSPEAVFDGLMGTTPIAVRRRGKYLLVMLDSGEAVMVHLRMSGQLLWLEADAARPSHTHVAVTFDGATRQTLAFVDPRTFGEVVVFDPERADVVLPELARLGVDPVADPFDRATLAAIVRGRSRLVKPLLLDQHVIAGIGNIYADEILHAAKVHPEALSSRLSGAAVTRLHSSIVRILDDAVAARGSTLVDARYVDLMGESGSYQTRHRVYGRAGLRCLTCGRGILRHLRWSGRSTVFCPVCQRLPGGGRGQRAMRITP
ncbi:MAG: bifunctional DNA-formamidopyrimidine glycosylase/DNA-(apurinic or apyrimidinic site) lyase [Actinomycetota bacterium]|nr:bifunctional DNA-formamidopyrimidine glycosylase/DNA-(apurinic or apyrimidinic site) lyase [Actinomycetota bacterium]